MTNEIMGSWPAFLGFEFEGTIRKSFSEGKHASTTRRDLAVMADSVYREGALFPREAASIRKNRDLISESLTDQGSLRSTYSAFDPDLDTVEIF